MFRLVFLTMIVFHLLLGQENIKLANWVSTQRQEAKLMREGRSTRLSEKKIDKLNAIGFVWVARECFRHAKSEVYLIALLAANLNPCPSSSRLWCSFAH
jgi:Helicase associated domain